MPLTKGIRRMCGQSSLIGQHMRVANNLTQRNGDRLDVPQCLCASRCRAQCEAVAFAGCNDSANLRILVAPSRSCSIDVA